MEVVATEAVARGEEATAVEAAVAVGKEVEVQARATLASVTIAMGSWGEHMVELVAPVAYRSVKMGARQAAAPEAVVSLVAAWKVEAAVEVTLAVVGRAVAVAWAAEQTAATRAVAAAQGACPLAAEAEWTGVAELEVAHMAAGPVVEEVTEAVV
jgi:hypothetical protein